MEASIPLNVGDAGEVPSGLQVAAIVAPILPKATPAIRATPEEANLWLSAGADDALALQRPLLDGALRIVAKGEKEDKAPSSLFDPHRHHTARVGAHKIWAETVSIAPDAKAGVHHHGELESVIYVVRGSCADAVGRATSVRRGGRSRRFRRARARRPGWRAGR